MVTELKPKKDDGRSPSNDKSVTPIVYNDAAGIGTGIENTQDPALKALEEYMKKKFEEAIYGSAEQKSANEFRYTDHKIFNNFYRTQLGKNVISGISSYCMDSSGIAYKQDPNNPENLLRDPSKDFLIDEEKIQENRKNNLKKLKEFGESETEGQKEVNLAYSEWVDCATKIQDICYNMCPTPSPSEENPPPSPCDTVEAYSKRRACEVTAYIKSARQALLSLDQIDEVYKRLDKDAKKGGQRVLAARSISSTDLNGNKSKKWRLTEYTGSEDGKSINELTNISSNEFINESKFSEQVENQKEELEKCKQGDQNFCKKFFVTGEDAQKGQDLILEYELRVKALNAKIDAGEIDAEQAKALLKEEGYTEEVGYDEGLIDKIANENQTVDEIKKRYKEEKTALVDSLKSKINKTYIASEEITMEDHSEEIGVIEKGLNNKVQNYKELIHFNNIVSGYLNITNDTSDEGQTNTSAMFHELENSAYDNEDDRSPSSGTSDYDTVGLREKIENAGYTDNRDQQDSTTLGVKEINDHLLNYSEEQKVKKPKK